MDRPPTGPIESDPIDYYHGRDLAALPALIDEAFAGVELGTYDRRILEWINRFKQAVERHCVSSCAWERE